MEPIEWSFSKMRRGEMNVDPVLREFFRGAELAENLVRESIQNSLDARRDDSSTVRVRIAFSNSGTELPAEEAADYTKGLWPHLQAVSLPDAPDEKDGMKFVAIEDFGTRGLCGDPKQDYVAEKGGAKKNDFFFFWRNYGRSSKRETQLGRWGVGKTVFAESSRISSFFGITVREEDDRNLLMGQSVVKTHSLGEDRYPPYGFFARFEGDGFPMPIDEEKAVHEFCTRFRLKRGNEPGLSVVIPYYRDFELTKDRLERAVIQHYFYPILKKELEVELEGVS